MEFSVVLPLLALAVSVAAFFRPEITRWFVILVGRVDYFPYERIEVGFTDHGPSVWLIGSFKSAYGELMIKRLRLKLRRLEDQSIHDFEWVVFRKLNYIDVAKSEFEPAIPVMATDKSERKLDVMFADSVVRAKIETPLLERRRAYVTWCDEHKVDFGKLSSEEWDAIQEQFDKSQTLKFPALNTFLREEIYWRSGSYELILSIETNARKRPRQYRYTFQLSREEAERLKLNSIWLLHTTCLRPNSSPGVADRTLTVFPRLQS